MTDYFVDDSGDNSDGSTWAKAFSSIYAMLNHGVNPRGTAGAPFASGDKCYIGNDTVDASSYSANTAIVGPASGLPAIFISSTVGSGTTVSYTPSTTRQIDTSNNGANTYTLTFDGSFSIYGVSHKSGGNTIIGADTDETFFAENCRFALGANSTLNPGSGTGSPSIFRNCVIDLTADGTTPRATAVISAGNQAALTRMKGLTFVNAGYRTASIIYLGSGRIDGSDFSGFTNGTDCELVNCGLHFSNYTISNCLTKDSIVLFTTDRPSSAGTASICNCGPSDAPVQFAYRNYFGDVVSSSSIYRTGGAAVEGDACSWLITTTATCAEGAPFYTPWIYGTVSSTGSKTFDLYITNDTGDFTDAECWLEVEYLSTSDEAIWALATDQRATITATAQAQTDDTTSTWNGTGPNFTYKQKLSVTATVGETGQYRARVAVGVASIAGSRYFYVDPKVSVT